MDAAHSGTGVFYQAMPAVGADGKNILKLIPVQMINGQFIQTPMSKPQTDPTPQKAVNINVASASAQMGRKAALNPPACRVFRQRVSPLPNPVGMDPRNSLNKHPLLPQTVSPMAKVPPKATLSTHSEKSLSASSQLPVTVKSPALPRGQYLQIPPHAQVRTVPASELPPGIKKQIFTSANSSPGSGAPSVVYVSPVTTVTQCVGLPSDPALHSLQLLSRTPNTTACGPSSKGSKRHLKLIPKVSYRPNSPIKWMIEEEESSTTTPLPPLNSPSEIRLAMTERKNAAERCDVTTEPVSQVIPTKGGQGEGNALVMCNGKVFFLAKKSSLPHRMGKGDSAAPSKDGEFNKSTAASSRQSLGSVTTEIRQDDRIIISDELDEVIDLCDDDDDDDDDSSQQAAPADMSAVSHLDEDNVIFVSYIPPKSESRSEQDLTLKTQMAPVKGSDRMETSSSDTVIEQKSPDGAAGRDESPVRRETAGHSMLVSTVQNVPHVCDSAVVKMCDTDCSNLNSPRSTSSTQQLERVQSPAGPSATHSSSGVDSHNIESSLNPATELTPALAPKSHQMADHLLRRMFNVTADVKVWLQRIDEASARESVQSESVRSAENLQEAASGLKSKDLLLQGSHSPQETRDQGLINVKPGEVMSEQKLLSDSSSQSPNIHTGPLKCSHLEQNTNPLSALKSISSPSSPTGTSCDVAPDSVLGYVEPIDEDFLSTDENDIPNSQDTDTPPPTTPCVDPNANTRRMGRTRKRTICPCCIAGSQVPAVKYSTKTEEAEKWTWTTEKTSKKGGRTKALRKAVKTSGRNSCLTAMKQQTCTHEVPANDGISTTSTDNDESKRREQMKRLKDLLREKSSFRPHETAQELR